jgi:hypothetical protein
MYIQCVPVAAVYSVITLVRSCTGHFQARGRSNFNWTGISQACGSEDNVFSTRELLDFYIRFLAHVGV